MLRHTGRRCGRPQYALRPDVPRQDAAFAPSPGRMPPPSVGTQQCRCRDARVMPINCRANIAAQVALAHVTFPRLAAVRAGHTEQRHQATGDHCLYHGMICCQGSAQNLGKRGFERIAQQDTPRSAAWESHSTPTRCYRHRPVRTMSPSSSPARSSCSFLCLNR